MQHLVLMYVLYLSLYWCMFCISHYTYTHCMLPCTFRLWQFIPKEMKINAWVRSKFYCWRFPGDSKAIVLCNILFIEVFWWCRSIFLSLYFTVSPTWEWTLLVHWLMNLKFLVTLLFNQALLFIPYWWSPKVPSVIHKQRCYTDIALTGLFPLSSTNP